MDCFIVWGFAFFFSCFIFEFSFGLMLLFGFCVVYTLFGLIFVKLKIKGGR